MAAESKLTYHSSDTLEEMIEKTRTAMLQASKELDFISAAQYRDRLLELQAQAEQQNKSK